MSAPLTAPLLHLNGSSAESLLDGYRAAHTALLQAEVALAASAPNARDYYPRDVGAFVRADMAHGDRLVRLRAIRAEIFALYDAVQTQEDERKARR